jgi:ABC-2 type transport system permease protein
MIDVALAVFRRDWEIERTYRMRLLLVAASTAGLAAGLYFVGRLVTSPPELEGYRGTYFDFALVGLAVTSFAGVGLRSFSTSMIQEQSTGTIDLLLASPASRGGLLTGLFLFPFLLAVAEVAALLGIGIGILGSGMPIGGLLMSIPILVLTTMSFAAVGIAAGGVLVIAKRGDPISGPFFQVTMLLSGAVYPVSVLPAILRPIAWCIPATWGVAATRDLLLGGAGWRDVLPYVAVLVAFVAVLLPLSLVAFRRCVGVARRRGLLGSY